MGKKKPTVPKKKVMFNYSEEAMQKALSAVHSGMPYLRAAKTFKVPRSTLKAKASGKAPLGRKMGPKSVLTDAEEETLVAWIQENANKGFPVKTEEILSTVQQFVVSNYRENPFKDNKPGKKWYQSFLKRHPELGKKSHVETAGILDAQMELEEVERCLKDTVCHEIMKNPARVFSFNELALGLCFETGRVLGQKGDSDSSNGDAEKYLDKDTISVCLTACWNGVLLHPFLVYPYGKVAQDGVGNIPDTWGLGKTESGWMTTDCFYEYVSKVFHPWMQQHNVQLPVLLFLDKNKSHLSMLVTRFCSENEIRLVPTHPNAVFKPLKDSWKETVHLRCAENDLTSANFPSLFKDVFHELSEACLENKDEYYDFYSFSPDMPLRIHSSTTADPLATTVFDPTLCTSNKDDFSCASNVAVTHQGCDRNNLRGSDEEGETSEKETKRLLDHLTFVESMIEPATLMTFKERLVVSCSWEGPERSKDLFDVWLKMRTLAVQSGAETK